MTTKHHKKQTDRERHNIALDGPVKMQLDNFAEKSGRSRRHIANAAIKEYVARHESGVTA